MGTLSATRVAGSAKELFVAENHGAFLIVIGIVPASKLHLGFGDRDKSIRPGRIRYTKPIEYVGKFRANLKIHALLHPE